MTDEIWCTTSGDVSSRLAILEITSVRSFSGRRLTSWAAAAPSRCAMMSAMVCGCSLRTNFDSCCGSVWVNEVKPAVVLTDLVTRSYIDFAASPPSALSSKRLTASAPPRVAGPAPPISL